MAAVIVKPGANRDRAVDRAPVPVAARRNAETGETRVDALLDQIARRHGRDGVQHVRTVIAMLVHRPIAVEPDTFKMGVHDEVDDAGDRVRSIHRRSAAGEDFDPLDQRSRDQVDVACLAGGVWIAR